MVEIDKKKTVDSHFGKRVELELPEGNDVLVLCYRTTTGLTPMGLCLPHQVYLKKLEEANDPHFEILGFVAIPASSKDYIDL